MQVINKQDQNKIQIFTICSILDFFFNKNFNIIIFIIIYQIIQIKKNYSKKLMHKNTNTNLFV